MHHEDRGDIIDRHAFIFEKGKLLAGVSPAYFNLFAFFPSVNFLVKLLFELGQNRLRLAAILARRIADTQHV